MKNQTPNTARTSVLRPPVELYCSKTATLIVSLLLVAIVCLLNSRPANAQEKKAPEKEFQTLSDSRKERKQLIDFLIKKGQANEVANGTLKALPKADADAKKAIAAENESRLRMFELIAAVENKSPEQVGREFHKQVDGVVPVPPVNVKPTTKKLLTLRGSASIGNSLAPDLMAAFLKEKGYKNVKVDPQKMSDLVKITGKNPKSPNETALVEIYSSNSAAAFGQQGLLGKSCDIGMASRKIQENEIEKMELEGLGNLLNSPRSEIPFAMDALTVIVHPDNPTVALSVLDVARLYAGYHREWASVNGGDCNFGVIDLYAREDTSGQWDNFQRLIMDPNKKKLVTEFTQRFVDNADIAKNVMSNPSGLGIISISDINPKLKVLKIKPHGRGPERLPTDEDMADGNYPLAYPVYFYLPEKAKPLAREFASFSAGPKGQEIVADSRMLALMSPKDRDSGRELIALVEKKKSSMIVAKPMVVVAADSQQEPSATPLPPTKMKRVIERAESVVESTQPPVSSEEFLAAYSAMISGADRSDSPNDLTFKSSYGTTLKPDSETDLAAILEKLKTDQSVDTKVIVIGFSDSRGSAYRNQQLSEQRAAAVAKKIKQAGIKTVEHAGFGEEMPVNSNMLAEGREQNRRVEIWIQR